MPSNHTQIGAWVQRKMSGRVIIVPFLLSFLFCFVMFFFCSRWSFVDVPLIFFWPADLVPDWQPRMLLGMVEARSVNVKNTTTTVRESATPDRKENNRQSSFFDGIFCASRCCVFVHRQSVKVYLHIHVQRECSAEPFMCSILSLRIFTSLPGSRLRFFIAM